MIVRDMRRDDLADVVRIHRAAFPNFFLSFLGPRFLVEFYGAVMRDGIALVAVDDDIIGFVAGVPEPRGFYRKLVRRRFAPIALALVPAIVRRPATIAKVMRRARQRTAEEREGVELMSLAVDPARQSRGAGRALVQAFAGRAGGRALWLTTDSVENDRVKSFYESLGFAKTRSFTNAEGRALDEYARPSSIPFARPDIGEEEIAGVTAVLRSGWLTTGERVQQFERELAAFVGARHAIAVNSCTAALHLALEAIGIGPGDEVIVPTYTFTATAEVVHYLGATPRLVDVDARTLNIDPQRVAEAVTEKTKAIIPVHFGGLAADLEALRAIAEPRGIAIIEDAAHALPARWRGRMIGAIGDVTCFSFYATKTITTGEGGMLCTDDDALAAHCRVMSLHGISHDAWKRYRSEGSWFYQVVAPGFKYNMTDIAGALGIAQLTKAEAMRARRQEIAERYNDAFAGEFDLPAFDAIGDHAWHLYPLRLRGIDRAKFIDDLRARGIGTSVHFIPLHLHPYYRDRFGYGPESFPVSTAEYEREVSLPIYSAMSDAEVGTVIAAVRDAAARLR